MNIRLLNIVFTAVLFFAYSKGVYASNTCDALFYESENSTYTVLVGDQTEIANQCNLATCHIYSWVSILERDYKIENKEELKISLDYLNAMHWLNESLLAVENNNLNEYIHLEENSITSRKAILSYGLIPDIAWTLNRDFYKSEKFLKIEFELEQVIIKAKINQKRSNNQSEKIKIKETAKNKIKEIFEENIGRFPKEFKYKNKQYTPQSFAFEFFSDLKKHVVQMRTIYNKAETTSIQTGPSYTVVNTSVDQIEKTTKELLDKGLNVYLSYSHDNRFIDNKTGVMSIAAFKTFFTLIDYKPFNGHIVQVVGYELDPVENKIIKWKIKNSWGTESGDNGYYHMYNDYFKTFVTSISFYKDANVDLPKVTPTLYNKFKNFISNLL